MFGRLLDDRLGKIHFWLMFIGFNLTFFPMHIVGLLGMPRRTWTYQAGLGFDRYNQLETLGATVLFLAFLTFLFNIIKTARKPADAPADPWNGATLEWSIPSPPQEFNFAEIPVVHSRDPLWEMKRERGGPLPEPPRVSGQGIHIPPGSYWPLVTAIGVAGVFIGIMLSPKVGPWAIAVGVGILFLGIYNWIFEPTYSTIPGVGEHSPAKHH